MAGLAEVATVTISAVRIKNKQNGLQCGATAMIEGSTSLDGEHFITYGVERSDDGRNIYVSVQIEQ